MTRTAAVRPTVAEIDLDAIRHNVALLRRVASPAALCAIVKADGYGHGALQVAVAALEAGATMLGVALVEEGVALRDAGIIARILVLSEPPLDAMELTLASNLEPAVYTRDGVQAALRAVLRAPGAPVWPMHLKVDTGMHRVGCAPDDAVALAAAIQGRPELVLGSVWTHGAVEDDPDNDFTLRQLTVFDDVVRRIGAQSVPIPFTHAANSAGTIAFPAARHDLVRCGIAIYGLPPSPAIAALIPEPGLRPAMRVTSAVSLVKVVPAGDGVSYGLRHTFADSTVVATVPIGYADGVRRDLGLRGGQVLIGGKRRPIVGIVTMDQLMVAVDESVHIGDEVVLIGAQGDEHITATEWAERLDTISYEVVCGISARVPRVHLGESA
ncbi:MAG TPA: alanine racemase [Acidimicrobiales bacterium]|nr:alanine racemase [Acidimicrobiales bacterium]